jgi:hypothetical protein
MVQSGSKPATTELEPQAGLAGPGAGSHSGAQNAQGDEREDEATLRGVVAIDVSRAVIARFSGTLILNELPERQPEVVLDRRLDARNDDDD